MKKPKIPNNPAKAYMLGKLHGTQENMGSVAMILCDKFGWHIAEETDDERDTHSVKRLYDCLAELAKEINSGRIKHKDIAEVLAEEHHTIFDD